MQHAVSPLILTAKANMRGQLIVHAQESRILEEGQHITILVRRFIARTPSSVGLVEIHLGLRVRSGLIVPKTS